LGALLLAALLCFAQPLALRAEGPPVARAPADLPPGAALDLGVLVAAYPGAVAALERDAEGRLVLALTNGQRLMYDDGLPRDQRQALENPDVRTMLAQAYPLGLVNDQSANPAAGFDPGRARVQALFTALYGASEAQVRQNCVAASFGGKRLVFNARFGAAQALARVWQHLQAQLPGHPEWNAILFPVGGTLAWRHIAGSKRLSMHSFGVAIDLNPHLPYWRNGLSPEAAVARRKAFAPEIIQAFEAEGFIWGGKWASFDLMHFEYRPEIILKARALAQQIK
jgi:hypothetical protein